MGYVAVRDWSTWRDVGADSAMLTVLIRQCVVSHCRRVGVNCVHVDCGFAVVRTADWVGDSVAVLALTVVAVAGGRQGRWRWLRRVFEPQALVC